EPTKVEEDAVVWMLASVVLCISAVGWAVDSGGMPLSIAFLSLGLLFIRPCLFALGRLADTVENRAASAALSFASGVLESLWNNKLIERIRLHRQMSCEGDDDGLVRSRLGDRGLTNASSSGIDGWNFGSDTSASGRGLEAAFRGMGETGGSSEPTALTSDHMDALRQFESDHPEWFSRSFSSVRASPETPLPLAPVRRCSVCRKPGHDRRTCPNREAREAEKPKQRLKLLAKDLPGHTRPNVRVKSSRRPLFLQ
ncbi:uncharacterized protein METZ01_LOCUS430175, partial [marine metagenome]